MTAPTTIRPPQRIADYSLMQSRMTANDEIGDSPHLFGDHGHNKKF